MRICVFCGSSFGKNPEYLYAAKAVGAALARRNIRLVYGGGAVGLMGAVADAALAAGGEVTGIIPRVLAREEISHPRLTSLYVTASMHERKLKMADLADAFIALPGGVGTLEETFEVWTWTQLGIHSKPIGLLNVAGFYDRLIAFADQLVEDGFVKPDHRAIALADDDPERLIDRLLVAEPPTTPKWIDPEAR